MNEPAACSSHLTAFEEAEIVKGQRACWLGSSVKEGKVGEVVGDGERWDGEDGAGASGETGEGAADYHNIVSPPAFKATTDRITALEMPC